MKIALVEFSESHEECIYSQLLFLKEKNIELDLVVNAKLKPQVNLYSDLVKTIIYTSNKELNFFEKITFDLKWSSKLSKYDKVIFNTCNGSKRIRNISLLLKPFKTECVGILHDTGKLRKSFTQNLINLKVRKIFVLSDHIKKEDSTRNKLESFYPIYFPEYNKIDINKSTNTFVCIPGKVEFKRRDYKLLIKIAKETKNTQNLKFIILGNINTKDGISLQKEIFANNLEDKFVFFNTFIKNDEFYSYIEKSDYIMPLLYSDDKDYLRSKITGSFNLAYGFKKTLIVHEFYEKISDLKESSIFYNNSTIKETFEKNIFIQNSKNNRYKNIKWDFEYQKEKYTRFINKSQ
jgi:hypothetical protein